MAAPLPKTRRGARLESPRGNATSREESGSRGRETPECSGVPSFMTRRRKHRGGVGVREGLEEASGVDALEGGTPGEDRGAAAPTDLRREKTPEVDARRKESSGLSSRDEPPWSERHEGRGPGTGTDRRRGKPLKEKPQKRSRPSRTGRPTRIELPRRYPNLAGWPGRSTTNPDSWASTC